MIAMRDLLRGSLAASLSELSSLDRLAAAWPVVAGHAIAERSAVSGYDGETVKVTAESVAWKRQLVFMAPQLLSDLARVSRVAVIDILFILPRENLYVPPPGNTRG